MNIHYFGHSAFGLTLDNGTRIVIDPYTAGAFGGDLRYGAIDGAFDVAVVSHDHEDHTDKAVLKRAKRVVRSVVAMEEGGAKIETISAFHDEAKGAKRGKILLTVVEAEGLRVAHLGDLGQEIGPTEVPALANLDVLMIPVGGYFTIDAAVASRVARAIAPRIAIPMHYKTSKSDFPITPVENFTKLMDNVERPGSSDLTVTKETLPATAVVVVLDAAN